MKPLETLQSQIHNHPSETGSVGFVTAVFSGLYGVLTQQTTAIFISCCGGLLGLVLCVMSIYHKWLLIKKDRG